MLNLEQQIIKQLENSLNTLIVFPENGGGDAVASALAFFLFLKKIGKNPEIAQSKISGNKSSLDF